jgi:hypothetical protein
MTSIPWALRALALAVMARVGEGLIICARWDIFIELTS